MVDEQRKRYLVMAAIRYIKDRPEGTVQYDGAECDGYCLVSDLAAEWDLTEEELERV
jgi:hypothetical protein